MNFKDCIKFANENPLCQVATVEGDQPRVRTLLLWRADNTGFYFQTQSAKALYTQLKNNKKVEIFFCDTKATKPVGTEKVMRVAGEIEFINDMALRAKVLETRPVLKEFGIKKPEDPQLVVFRVYTGEVYFWTKEYSMRESEIERLKF